jgi:spermidine synthase
VRSSTYAFSLMLAVYLLGIAAGSMAASGLAGRSRRPLLGLAACQVGVVAAVAAGLLAFPHLESLGFALIGSDRIEGFGHAVALMFAQASLILLLPTLFMGAMFPFGVAAFHRSSRSVGRTVGSLYAMNTVGNIAGAVLVGFATISLIGVRHSMLLMMALNLLVAAAILVRTSRLPGHRLLWPAAAVGILGVIHLTVSDQLFYQSHVRLPGTRIIFYREGASDTVAVIEREKPRKTRTLVYGDGRGAAGTGSLPWNLYFGHLPMLLHPDPQQILHICYGSGNSVMALSRHDPERIDVVELSPHVREASKYFWTNEGVLDLPMVNLIIEDGRNFLLGTDRSYDVVSLEPPNIFSAGVVNLYTQEFYELARDHLNPGGIMVQWLPTGTLSPTDRGHLIRAFTEAFPYAYVWQQMRSPQLLLMGTLEPLNVDVDDVQSRLAPDPFKRDLASMHVRDAAEYLSWFKLGDESTRRLAADYEPVRDDRTIVDYSIPHYIGSGFGFYLYTYRLGPSGYKVSTVSQEKIREYAEWGDPVSLIIPDARQARRVEQVIARRRAPATFAPEVRDGPGPGEGPRRTSASDS